MASFHCSVHHSCIRKAPMAITNSLIHKGTMTLFTVLKSDAFTRKVEHI
jgi:hypothetical protein